ncbi:MAG: hypothetical protein HC933_16715 [Pleurocapsa sp. SU_196_0]|nr:hypothetical protein [Pleurocapsa sp. SU_196_0]
MPNCDFYAYGNDFQAVLGFVFSQPGWILHELVSQPDTPVAVFSSVDSVLEHHQVGARPINFQLYAPEMRGRVRHERIQLAPGAVEGATHRFSTEGWGLIQLYFGFEHHDGITHSHTNHNTERRAQAWAVTINALDDPGLWDWTVVSRMSARLNRFIHKSAAARFGSRPILPAAQAALASGKTCCEEALSNPERTPFENPPRCGAERSARCLHLRMRPRQDHLEALCRGDIGVPNACVVRVAVQTPFWDGFLRPEW